MFYAETLFLLAKPLESSRMSQKLNEELKICFEFQ